MKTLQEIESAIQELPPVQRWDLFHHLQDTLWNDWDCQIEADHAAGRLDDLLSEVRADISAGKLKTLNEVLGNV